MPRVGYQSGQTRSMCNDCGNTAARFWGRVPYCNRCLIKAQIDDPMDHMCPTCKQEQAPQCEWFGTDPCSVCKGSIDDAGLCSHVVDAVKSLSALGISIWGDDKFWVKCYSCSQTFKMPMRPDAYVFGAEKIDA